MRNTVLAVTLSTAVLVSGCVTDGQNGTGAGSFDKETVGTVLGGVLGAVVGSRFGKGNGQLAAAALGAVAGGYFGKQFGASLDVADKEALEHKSAEALSSARDGEAVGWSNPATGASAVITPQGTHQEARKVAMLRDKSVAPLPTLELLGETWEAKTSANVRSAPSLDANVVSGLKSGETFTAVGKVEGKDWIVVGRGNRTIGYVASSLVQKASPQTVAQVSATSASAPSLRAAIDLDALENDQAIDLDAENLVAEEVATTSTCRNMNVAITTKDGGSEQQEMKACKAADGAWEII